MFLTETKEERQARVAGLRKLLRAVQRCMGNAQVLLADAVEEAEEGASAIALTRVREARILVGSISRTLEGADEMFTKQLRDLGLIAGGKST